MNVFSELVEQLKEAKKEFSFKNTAKKNSNKKDFYVPGVKNESIPLVLSLKFGNQEVKKIKNHDIKENLNEKFSTQLKRKIQKITPQSKNFSQQFDFPVFQIPTKEIYIYKSSSNKNIQTDAEKNNQTSQTECEREKEIKELFDRKEEVEKDDFFEDFSHDLEKNFKENILEPTHRQIDTLEMNTQTDDWLLGLKFKKINTNDNATDACHPSSLEDVSEKVPLEVWDKNKDKIKNEEINENDNEGKQIEVREELESQKSLTYSQNMTRSTSNYVESDNLSSESKKSNKSSKESNLIENESKYLLKCFKEDLETFKISIIPQTSESLSTLNETFSEGQIIEN